MVCAVQHCGDAEAVGAGQTPLCRALHSCTRDQPALCICKHKASLLGCQSAPGVPLDVLNRDALLGVDDKDAVQQVLALRGQLQVRGEHRAVRTLGRGAAVTRLSMPACTQKDWGKPGEGCKPAKHMRCSGVRGPPDKKSQPLQQPSTHLLDRLRHVRHLAPPLGHLLQPDLKVRLAGVGVGVLCSRNGQQEEVGAGSSKAHWRPCWVGAQAAGKASTWALGAEQVAMHSGRDTVRWE